MKCVHPSAHPGYTDFWRGEGFVVRLCEQVLEVQFLYFRVGSFLQNSPVTALSQCSSYIKKRSSYCNVKVQFLYHKTVQLLYCHRAVSMLENGPVTVLSQCNIYINKRSSYCIVTVQFLYYKTVKILYCHSEVPIQQNSPVTVFSQCRSYTTKRTRYCIVTV